MSQVYCSSSAPSLFILPGSCRRLSALPLELDFEHLLGPAAWQRLAPEIRERFAHGAAAGRPARYAGTMHRVECSLTGLLLAQLCRLIGTPFAPFRGSDVPVTIELRRDRTGIGMVWQREYANPGGRPIPVISIKQMAADGGLLELVGGGFGMRLAVHEDRRALHFRSLHYFWRVGPWRLILPGLLSPGEAHVVHEELGGRRFHFVMTIRHRVLGVLFHQDGTFEDEGGTS